MTGKAGSRPSSEQKQPSGDEKQSSGNGKRPSGKPERLAGGGEETAAQIPYEQARDQLTEVVKRLEGGGLTLEESLALWERGEQLAAICTQWLEGARARLAAAMPQPTDAGDGAAPF